MAGMIAPPNVGGSSNVTLRQFFTAVLQGLRAPVTENNLAKLAAVARQEGRHGTYNPFNYVVGPGTNLNSAGVKNFPDLKTGIDQTIRLLSQRNTAPMRANLMADSTYGDWLNRTSAFYGSWGGGPVRISPQNATTYLGNFIEGSPGGTGPRNFGLSGPTATGVNTLPYQDWIAQGWAAASKYHGESPLLTGMMQDFLRRYPDTSNLGGYNPRGAKGNPTMPSAHAFGAATDWGYGKDRNAANQVIAMLTSNPAQYGIQEIHDYVNSRVWKVGRGWIPQAKGSHGGDMGRPGATWLHLEVSPSRYSSTWGGSAPNASMTTPAMLPGMMFRPPTPAMLPSLLSAIRPSISTAPPVTQLQRSNPAAPTAGRSPYDLGTYTSATGVPTATQSLARMIAQKRM